MRVIRTLRALGIRPVAVYTQADAGAPHVAAADVAVGDRELPLDRGGDRGGAGDRRGGDPPRLRLPQREHRVRRRLRGGRDHLRRPAGAGDRGHGRQDPRQADRRRGRRPGRARVGRDRALGRRAGAGRRAGRLPGADQAVGRRWREGHARGAPGRRPRRRRGLGPARGARRVRRRHPARRTPGHDSPAHRDPGAGRRARQRDPPRRARVLAAAPAPEDRRGGAVAAADAPAARGHGRRRLRGGPGLRLHRGGHRRVHRRGRLRGGWGRTRLVLHGDEHPAAGRAPGHRGGHRARPRGAAAAGGGGGAAAADAGRRRPARARDRGPGLRRRTLSAGFLPTGGRVLALHEPRDLPGVRVDSGIAAGFVVGSDYDPMLSKIIAHGADRAEALHRLDAALRRTVLLGLGTNIGFLRALLADPDVRAGNLDTGLVGRRVARAGEGGPARRRRGPRHRDRAARPGARAARSSTRSTSPAAGASASTPGPPAGSSPPATTRSRSAPGAAPRPPS